MTKGENKTEGSALGCCRLNKVDEERSDAAKTSQDDRLALLYCSKTKLVFLALKISPKALLLTASLKFF
jgi:hypothetical protein